MEMERSVNWNEFEVNHDNKTNSAGHFNIAAGVIWTLSSNIIGNDETNFPHELLIPNRQV